MNIDLIRKKLIYRSVNRGCKEMDVLLGEFAEQEVPKLCEFELSQFERLIEVDDTVMYNWVTGKEAISEEFNNSIFQKILKFNSQRCPN